MKPSPAAPAEPSALLRAGPVTAELVGTELRHVRLGAVDLVDRVYVAVRDQDWNTIPGVVGRQSIDQRDDGFSAAFEVRCRHLRLDLRWRGRIEGFADGSIAFDFDGVAESDFRYCKIGICVHHPLSSHRGQPYRARGPEGTSTGVFPVEIEPQLILDGRITAMFPAFEELEVDLAQGPKLRLAFEGDLFEMQDHRNWTDANYKTYGTPLSVPFPMDAERGHRFFQRLGCSVGGIRASQPPPAPPTGRLRVLGPVGAVPAIGLGAAAEDGELGGDQEERLASIGLDHLRVIVDPRDEGSIEFAELAGALARRLRYGLELALLADPEGVERAGSLLGSLADVARRVAVCSTSESAGSYEDVLATARRAFPLLPIVGGTQGWFVDLNRERVDPATVDAVTFTICPQVHGSDDETLMANLPVQRTVIEEARRISGGLDVRVGEVTLLSRHGPFPAGPPDGQGLETACDPRLQGLFGAAWTAGSLGQVMLGQATAVNYFQAVGPRGLLSAHPDAAAGAVVPAYHVIADACSLRGGTVHAVEGTPAGEVGCFAVSHARGLTVVIANLTREEHAVALVDLSGDNARVRRLGPETLDLATDRPGEFRAAAESLEIRRGELELDLSGLSTVRVDVTG